MTDAEMTKVIIESLLAMVLFPIFVKVLMIIVYAMNESIDANERDPERETKCNEKKPKS